MMADVSVFQSFLVYDKTSYMHMGNSEIWFSPEWEMKSEKPVAQLFGVYNCSSEYLTGLVV